VQGVLAPTSLTIAAANSETTNSFGLKIPSGNPTATVVTASSGALTTATCSVNR
jgi:hypothetical protein